MVKRGGTLPRYDWEDKRDICYKLFVEEKKSVSQILEYFSELFDVDISELPSKKVFHRQFTEKWGFPKRHATITEEQEQQIAATMHQMWEQNCLLKDIHKALIDQGHNVNLYDFNKLRKKYKLNRRGEAAYTPLNANGKRPRESLDTQTEEDQAMHAEFAAAMPHLYPPPPMPTAMPAAIPAVMSMGQGHNANSMNMQIPQAPQFPKVLGSKRRKRQRGFGDENDPNAQPSYGSETSLDECKAFLSLNNTMYLDLRADYDAICRDMGIDRKKTSLGDGRWQASKDRLVRNNKHLSAEMNPLQPDLQQKELALDLICADVTKRLRDSRKAITVGAANNILGLNPAQSKELRRKFYIILEQDGYTTRESCGDAHWAELLLMWYQQSELLTQIMRENDPEKMKAVKVLSRDASKRFNDDKAKDDPSRKQYTRSYYGPGPGAATHRAKSAKKTSTTNSTPAPNPVVSPQQAGQVHSVTPTATPTRPQRQQPAAPQMQGFDPAAFAQSLDPALMSTMSERPVHSAHSAPSAPVPAYFRLDAGSNLAGPHPRVWLTRLDGPNMVALHNAAVSKAGGARVRHVHGLVIHDDKTEDKYRIDREDELSAYLETAGSKATFLVALDAAYT